MASPGQPSWVEKRTNENQVTLSLETGEGLPKQGDRREENCGCLRKSPMPYPMVSMGPTHPSSQLLNFQQFYELVEVTSLKLTMELVFTLLNPTKLQMWTFLHPFPSPAPGLVVRHLPALLSLQPHQAASPGSTPKAVGSKWQQD